jgi:hypothetical protein
MSQLSTFADMIKPRFNFEISAVICTVAAGLYPFLFYVSNNYDQINGWRDLTYLVGLFMALPLVLVLLLPFVLTRILKFSQTDWILANTNIFCFLFLIHLSLYAGFSIVAVLVIIPVSFVLTYVLRRYLKKLVIIEFILAIVAFFFLVPSVLADVFYSDAWKQQADAIVQAEFTRTPNVYFIQPDGYPGFSELAEDPYSIDVSEFKGYLENTGFKIYKNFRSNYASTLTSNSATFAMKHHYYNYDVEFGKSLDAGNVILGNNAVLSVFKKNGYKTIFLSEKSYLHLYGDPEGYDNHNFEDIRLSGISSGLKEDKDVIDDLERYNISPDQAVFFFIQIFEPWHISVKKSKSRGVTGEKVLWEKRLRSANEKLTTIIGSIRKEDPNGLIIIMADHGGYVGLEYMNQLFQKTTDPRRIRSIFGSLLAIHWPENETANFDASLKTPVNLFRVLIAYLSENKQYLEHLESDKSFAPIKKGAKKGIYCYIDAHGEFTFERQEKE